MPFLSSVSGPGVTREAVESTNRRAHERAAALRTEGSSLRFLGSLFVPADETVFFQYAAATNEEVIRASQAAQLPFKRITSSLWLESEESSCDPS
jgi:hypothetical protein